MSSDSQFRKGRGRVALLAATASALACLSVVALRPNGVTPAGAQSTSSPTPAATSSSQTPAATAGASLATATVAATQTATPASATPSATASATPVAAGARTGDDEESGVDSQENPRGGGHNNIVRVVNQKDNRLRLRGSVQLNHIGGDTVNPTNEAVAYGSCTGCDTYAVALQIDLISDSASQITPQNYAVAYNYQCTGCDTVARALQYVVQVDDPDQVPDDVRRLIDSMNDQLQAAAHDRSVSDNSQVDGIVNSVIAQFSSLGQSLYDQRDETVQPTNTDQPPSDSP